MALKGERPDKPTYTQITPMTDSGNTGVTYSSDHGLFEQKVFQKTISLLGLADGTAYNEPQFLKSFRHDHIVEVWEAQWDPDPAWKLVKAITIVMPFYEGGSVQDALDEDHPFSVGEAVGIACGLFDALHYLHVEEKVLHRELKPRNVLLDETRTWPYLADFGSAIRIPAGHASTGVVTSAPLSRPPEACRGVFTAKGDVYAAGMLLHECLNGRLPYDQLDRDRMEARLALGKVPVPVRLLKAAPHIPKSVARIVKRLIDPDPERRPTALQAQRALEKALHMDWKPRLDGTARVWDGRWPPADRPGAGRLYEVRADQIVTGRYKGELLLTARWRRAGAVDWRQFKSLERRVRAGDAGALAGFFRAVEAAAQTAAAA